MTQQVLLSQHKLHTPRGPILVESYDLVAVENIMMVIARAVSASKIFADEQAVFNIPRTVKDGFIKVFG